MALRKKPAVAVATAITASMALAACGGGGDSGGSAAKSDSTTKGGTLTYYYETQVSSWDPARTYTGVDLSNQRRLFSRALVQLPVTADKKKASEPMPDLATDTGTKTDGAKTWKFTLKDGVTWQDGKPVTCEDAKYGVSRRFDPNLTGGSTYSWAFLDMETKDDGTPVYQGPTDTKNQAMFDKAVSCSGKTITYKFKKAFPDFPLAIASLSEFDPYRKDQDKGIKNNLTIFSNGPYMLQGTWQPNTGGMFVRNPKFDAKTDGNRKALPDKIDFKESQQPGTTAQKLIQDNGVNQTAVMMMNVPPANLSQIKAPNVKDRVENPQSPFTDYLQPNVKKLTNPKVRQALATGLDQAAYVKAYGGAIVAEPAKTIVAPSLLGYTPNPTLAPLGKGDVAAAKKILQSAGVPMPYPIKFTYRANPARTAGAAALASVWNQAGFKVTLNGLQDKYYPTIQTPADDSDLYWAGWGPDWSSQSTVLPPLFDSRVNLTATSKSQDYGSYSSKTVNDLFDKAANQTDVNAAAKIYSQADAQLGKDYAYLPLIVQKFVFLRGSKVTNYINNPATSMYPDLGSIGVSK